MLEETTVLVKDVLYIRHFLKQGLNTPAFELTVCLIKPNNWIGKCAHEPLFPVFRKAATAISTAARVGITELQCERETHWAAV